MTDRVAARVPLPSLSRNQGVILDALLNATIAWQSIEQLESKTQLAPETLLDELADLDASGWLESWERSPGPVVTLTVAGASRLGARIVEHGRMQTPRWARRDEPDPVEPIARNITPAPREGGVAGLADPRPGPEALAIENEEAARAMPKSARKGHPVRGDRIPPPTILLGTGLTPFPGPAAVQSPCPACHGAPLQPRVYCLCCDRWGLDHLLVEPTPVRRRCDPPEVTKQSELRRQFKERRVARRRARLHTGDGVGLDTIRVEGGHPNLN